MLNVVVPLAEIGAFEAPVLQRLISASRPGRPHRFTFIARPADLAGGDLAAQLKRHAPTAVVLADASKGPGSAGPVLHARDRIENANPLVVVLADRIPAGGVHGMLDEIEREQLDAVLLPTQPGRGLSIDFDGSVTGLHDGAVAAVAFRRGCDFVRAACAVLAAGHRDGGGFTVAAVVNRLISAHATVGVYHPLALRAAA